MPPRVTGRSRLKIQFETAGFERRVRVSWCRAAAAAAPHRRGGGGGGGARRFRRRGRLFSVASVAHTPLCDSENRRTAHSGVSQEVFLTHRRVNGGGPGDLLRSTIPSVKWKPQRSSTQIFKKKSSGWNYFPLCETPGWFRGLENVKNF